MKKKPTRRRTRSTRPPKRGQDDPAKANTPIRFNPSWTLAEAQKAIRAEEKKFKHDDGRVTPAELLLFSVDEAETTNVGVFEEEAEPSERAVVLVDEVPTDDDDREQFFLTLGRRGLEMICYSDVLVKGKLTEVAVCRSIAETTAPAVEEPPVTVPGPVSVGLITQDAFDLIIHFEGLDQPGKWPGAASGITLGVGYDLGYVTASQLQNDWGRHLTETQVARLKAAIGLTGGRARGVAPRFADIRITRAAGMEVFNRCTLPRFTKITRAAFPGMERLPLNAQGALISLVFNRGSKMDGGSRREMAEIRRLIQSPNLAAVLPRVLKQIADEIRGMKRLWDIGKLRGLHRRRDAEADLVARSSREPGTLIQIIGSVIGGGGAPPAEPVAPVAGQTGARLVSLAKKHCDIGEKYRLGAFVPKDLKNPTGPWDCAEFVSWCVYQLTGVLYGCEDNSGNPATADAYTGYWERDAKARGKMISVEEAARIPGAIVLRYPPRTGVGHIAISDGRGGTLEAKGTQFGVVTDRIGGRRWDTGLVIAEIDYQSPSGPVVAPVAVEVYFVDAKGMDKNVVIAIQDKLRAAGFDPGPSDGDYGDQTAEAVLAYQTANHLMVDGEVGPETAASLGVSLTVRRRTTRVSRSRRSPRPAG